MAYFKGLVAPKIKKISYYFLLCCSKQIWTYFFWRT